MGDGSDVVSVYVTARDAEEAERLAAALVTERLAACVNCLPGLVSVYHWEGEVQRENELLLFCKTTRARADALCERIQELHSYDVPCAVVLPILGGHEPYLEWIRGAVG